MFQKMIAALFFFFLSITCYAQREDLEPPEVVVVGVNESRPMAYWENDILKGIEIDDLRDIAKMRRWELKFVRVANVGDGLTMLNARDIDVLVGAISVTEDRENSIDYTRETYPSGKSIAVPVDATMQSANYIAGIWHAFFSIEMGILVFTFLIFAGAFGYMSQQPGWKAHTITGLIGGILALGLVVMIVAVNWRVSDQFEQIVNIAGPEDLYGLRVATERSTASFDDLIKEDEIETVGFDTIEDAILVATSGPENIDALVFDTPVLLHYASQGTYGTIRLVGTEFDRHSYAMAVHEDSEELLESLDKSIIKLQRTGVSRANRKRYFGLLTR